jgi:hypothetical protein
VNAEHICVTFSCPPGQRRLHGNCPDQHPFTFRREAMASRERHAQPTSWANRS